MPLCFDGGIRAAIMSEVEVRSYISLLSQVKTNIPGGSSNTSSFFIDHDISHFYMGVEPKIMGKPSNILK